MANVQINIGKVNVARFLEKVDVASINECWAWTGATCRGHGQVGIGGKVLYAHRVAFAWLRSESLVDGMTIDHLCRNRGCVNPWHLEQVSRGENVLRGEGFAAENAKKTHCPSGHAYSAENTRTTKDGHRQCKECARDRGRESYRRDPEKFRARARAAHRKAKQRAQQ